jgi:chemotaxis protein CheD
MRRISLPDLGGRELSYLHAGDIIVRTTPSVVTTILGSCVSVTFYCPRLKASSICHAQFPAIDRKKFHPNENLFADAAVSHMHEMMLLMGAKSGELTAKVFGGGRVLKSSSYTSASSIGQKNAQAALKALSSLGITPAATLLECDRGLRLFFFTDTGEVLLRKTQIA